MGMPFKGYSRNTLVNVEEYNRLFVGKRQVLCIPNVLSCLLFILKEGAK
jgi:hypothetical protein